MNVYGDRGNVIALTQRCHWRGIEPIVKRIEIGDTIDTANCDILFMGGGQDKEQVIVSTDLVQLKASAIKALIEDGAAALVVCGGFQLFGKYFKTGTGEVLQGIELFDAWTLAGDRRCIGDVVVECTNAGERHTLVGFENHSGQTYLGPGCEPLGKVLVGFGNNVQDKVEGAAYKNAFGTYLHGSLLPKNPWMTDRIILAALRRKYGADVELASLDDTLENAAHNAVIERIHRRGHLNTGAT
jgi:CobQ-like glutamine amidotransferase family enzyme